MLYLFILFIQQGENLPTKRSQVRIFSPGRYLIGGSRNGPLQCLRSHYLTLQIVSHTQSDNKHCESSVER